MSERVYRPEDLANPSHYREGGKECIDAMPEHFRKWIKDEAPSIGIYFINNVSYAVKLMMLGFCVGNAFKYRWRRGRKDDPGKEDAKADWYERFARHVLAPTLNPDPRDQAG